MKDDTEATVAQTIREYVQSDAPSDGEIMAGFQRRHEALARRHRNYAVIGVAAAVVLVTGGLFGIRALDTRSQSDISAAVPGGTQTSTATKDGAWCYTRNDPNDPDRQSFGVYDREGNMTRDPVTLIGVCNDLMKSSAPNQGAPRDRTVCVLPDGRFGVFPGAPCDQLGLQALIKSSK